MKKEISHLNKGTSDICSLTTIMTEHAIIVLNVHVRVKVISSPADNFSKCLQVVYVVHVFRESPEMMRSSSDNTLNTDEQVPHMNHTEDDDDKYIMTSVRTYSSHTTPSTPMSRSHI